MREGVLFILLPVFSDAGSVVLAAAIMRVLTLLAELALVLFFYPAQRLHPILKRKLSQETEEQY